MAQRRGRSLRAPLAIVGVLGLIGGAVVAVRAVAGGDGNCDSGVRLVVAAAPDIAPAVRDAAARWSATKPQVSGDCVQVQVRAAEPADVANQLAARAGGAINVAATALPSPADADVPTVWIPDSTAWIVRMQAVSRRGVRSPTPRPSPPARSPWPCPISSRVPSTPAARPARRRSRRCSPRSPPSRSSSPRSTPAAAPPVSPGAGLLYDSIVTEPKKLVDVVKAYRSIAVAADQAALNKSAGPAQVAPMSEQAVIAYNASGPAAPAHRAAGRSGGHARLPVRHGQRQTQSQPRSGGAVPHRPRRATATGTCSPSSASAPPTARPAPASRPAAAPPPPRSRSSPSPSRRRSTTFWGTGTPPPPRPGS